MSDNWLSQLRTAISGEKIDHIEHHDSHGETLILHLSNGRKLFIEPVGYELRLTIPERDYTGSIEHIMPITGPPSSFMRQRMQPVERQS